MAARLLSNARPPDVTLAIAGVQADAPPATCPGMIWIADPTGKPALGAPVWPLFKRMNEVMALIGRVSMPAKP